MKLYSIYVCDEYKNNDSMKMLCEIKEDKLNNTLVDLILSDIGEIRTIDIYKGVENINNEVVKLSEEEIERKEIDRSKLESFINDSSLNKLNTFLKYLYIQPKRCI